MADNITLPGTAAVVGTETVTMAPNPAAQVQQVKVLFGAIDTGTEITTGTPLPVVQTGTPALPTGAATQTTLASIDTKFPAQGQALAAASVPVVLTAAQVATLAPLASVSVSNFPATQPVSGAFFQATQPVSMAAVPTGAALDASVATLNTNVGAQADAAASADTGAFSLIAYTKRIVAKLTSLIGLFPGALGAGGGLKIDGSGTALPVSGTVAVSGTVPVSGTFFQGTQPVSGTVAISGTVPTSGALATSSGWSPFHSATLTNTPAAVKGAGATAGQVGGFEIFNTTAAVRYVKLYDKATAPTVGTDVPKVTLLIPAGGGAIKSDPSIGRQFALGIWVAATNLPADTDNTAGTSGDVLVNIGYN